MKNYWGFQGYSPFQFDQYQMSWLPQDKLTAEEKEKLKAIQQRKDTLIGKYHTQIKSQTTTHETWLNTFITDNTKKRVQKCNCHKVTRLV